MPSSKASSPNQVQSLKITLRQKEQALDSARQSLGSVVRYLTTAAEGQDSKLDKAISELRSHLRTGDPSPELIDRLAKTARAMSAIRRRRADKQLQGFTDCVAQLLLLDPPADVQKQLSEFVRAARKVIANPEAQELLPTKYARLQGVVLNQGKRDIDRADDDAAGQILDVEALFEDDTLEGLPAYSNVAETIESILTDMLVQIRPPERAEPALDRARQILSAGLNWYELAALLEQLSQVVFASLDNDQQEFELFLQALNQRLSDVSDGVGGVCDVTQAVFASGEEFDSHLREDMQCFAGELESASSLDALKGSVRSHLDTVFSQLDRYQLERSEQLSEYQQEVQVLRDRVQSMEREAQSAQAEIEAQQQRSERDCLTELPNRDAYVRRIGIELERWQRYSRQFCLVVADIDHFKTINDSYGHLAGDKVLKVLSKTIRQRLRRADFIARYGGEEFVIILPETNAEAALKAMNQVREQIRACPFHFKSDPLEITVSFGIAEVAVDDDAESLFSRADEALYAAKERGRDRCELAGGSDTQSGAA